MNWNNLGEGDHTVKVFVDGRAATSRQFTVVNYGQEFRKGIVKEWTLEDWPDIGTDTTIAWSESKQNIEIVDIVRPDLPQSTELTPLLGEWFFGDHPDPPRQGSSYTLNMTDIDNTHPYEPRVRGTAATYLPAYGRRNTRRWLSQPLQEYEFCWIAGYGDET